MASELLSSMPVWQWAATGLAAHIAYKALRFAFGDADFGLLGKSLPRNAFNNKVIAITGGSSGIGLSLAQHFSRFEGVKLILSSRKQAALEEARDTILATKGCKIASKTDIAIVPLDLGDIDSLPEAGKNVLEAFGRVDLLVNNGGISMRACLPYPTSMCERVMRIDFLGQVALTNAILPSMREQGSGHIVNISSLAGKFGVVGRTAYSAAKSALLKYFDAARAELYHEGIRVTNICPGFIRTNIARNALNNQGQVRGQTDDNIEAGLSVDRCSELVLTAIHHELYEAWISKQPNLTFCYLHQHAPDFFKSMLIRRAPGMLKQMADTNT